MSLRLPVLVLLAVTLLCGCARPVGTQSASPAASAATSSSVGATGSVSATVSVPVGESRVTVGGLDLAFRAFAQAPDRPPQLAAGHRWLAVEIAATNSTDATVDVLIHDNPIIVRDSVGARVLPYAGSRDTTGFANFLGDIDISGTTTTPPPRLGPEGLKPGGVMSVTAWCPVRVHGGPFSVTWMAGSGKTVVFHTP